MHMLGWPHILTILLRNQKQMGLIMTLYLWTIYLALDIHFSEAKVCWKCWAVVAFIPDEDAIIMLQFFLLQDCFILEIVFAGMALYLNGFSKKLFTKQTKNDPIIVDHLSGTRCTSQQWNGWAVLAFIPRYCNHFGTILTMFHSWNSAKESFIPQFSASL